MVLFLKNIQILILSRTEITISFLDDKKPLLINSNSYLPAFNSISNTSGD